MHETPMLMEFFRQHLLGGGGQPAEAPGGLDIFASDVDGRPAEYWWPGYEEWTAHTFNQQIRLQIRQQDLATEALLTGAYGFVLGVHPLVAGINCDGPWRLIIANVMRSCRPGARCIFATFYQSEVDKLQGMLKDIGYKCEVRESPHYAGVADTTVGTHLRFAAIVNVPA